MKPFSQRRVTVCFRGAYNALALICLIVANRDVDSDTPFSVARAAAVLDDSRAHWYTTVLVQSRVISLGLYIRVITFPTTLKCAYIWTRMKFVCTNSDKVLGL